MVEQANRIQTSVLNKAEKKVLVWLAHRQPSWVSSDTLTVVGFIGAVIIAAGYILTNININWLWLCSFGYVVNWYGDSLDGTLARVRNCQRPVYGFYIDHTVDAVNELLMFFGAGLSSLMNLPVALTALVFYLMITLNVSVNAHLRGESKLTYFKMGPTELRILMILINTAFIIFKPLADYSRTVTVFGQALSFGILDYVAIFIIVMLAVIYFITIRSDAKYYSEMDPRKK